MVSINKYKDYAPFILRIGISLVLLWFGLNQIFDTESWLGWLPQWAFSLSIEPTAIIILNGIFETIFGALLLLGLVTRFAAVVISVHLLIISFSIGYNDVAVRDFGLSLATFSIFLYGPDRLSLDKKIKVSRFKDKFFIKLFYFFDD